MSHLARFLVPMSVLFVTSVCGRALADVNAGGTIVVHDAGLLIDATDGSVPVCSQGVIPSSCSAVDARIDGANDASTARLFVVYAAFIPGIAPMLQGVVWGVQYPPELTLVAWHMCGDFELNDDAWPASGSGSSVFWNLVQRAYLTPIYWFAGYRAPRAQRGALMQT